MESWHRPQTTLKDLRRYGSQPSDSQTTYLSHIHLSFSNSCPISVLKAAMSLLGLATSLAFSELSYFFPEMCTGRHAVVQHVCSNFRPGRQKIHRIFPGSGVSPGEALTASSSSWLQKTLASQRWFWQICHWEGILRNYTRQVKKNLPV